MTKIRNLFLLAALVAIAAVALHGITGGGSTRTRTDDKAETYLAEVAYHNIMYVVDIQVIVSNHPNPPVKLDQTGAHGVKIGSDGVWKQDIVYVKGTGGIVVELTLASDNVMASVATCEIWKTHKGAKVIRVAGPIVADRGNGTACTYDYRRR